MNLLSRTCFRNIVFFLLLISQFSISAQVKGKKYKALLDSVKSIYGDTCYIGVSSNLIKKLSKYKSYPEVANYLSEFYKIKKNIAEFRSNYINTLTHDAVILLDLSRVFKSSKQCNIVNACGIFFGADSVTNVAMSYFIIRNALQKSDESLLQIGNIDPLFKKELTSCGTDWFNSLVLKKMLSDGRLIFN